MGKKYLDLEKLSHGYLGDISVDDFLVKEKSGNFNLYLFDVTNLGEEEVDKIFQTARIVYALRDKFNYFITFFPEGNDIVDFLSKKGRIYTESKNKNIEEIIRNYVDGKHDLEKYMENLMKKIKLKRSDHSVNSMSEINTIDVCDISKLYSFEDVKKFCNEMYEYAAERIIGQNEALQDLVIKLCNYLTSQSFSNNPIFIIGPTGSGKTYSVRILASKLGIPFIEIPTPQLSPTSYKGTSIQDTIFSAIKKQIDLLNGYPNKMILYFDEFGKILQRGGGQTDFSVEIQNEFLNLLEKGAIIQKDEFFSVKTLPLNAMIILSDALSYAKKKTNNYNDHITRNDLIDMGFIPELAGRIQAIIPFKKLNRDDFIQMIKGVKDSNIEELYNYYKNMKIDIKLEESGIQRIAEIAEEEGFGGRSVNNIIATLLQKGAKEIIFEDSKSNCITINSSFVDKYWKEDDIEEKKIGF
ncbi:MAG: AAA family ATPase [Candidatus Aenigmatarchaeota archaeon]